MTTNREQLRYAVQEFLNDVIEQGFHHLINHPQSDTELNSIIKEATDELNAHIMRIDNHELKGNQPELEKHYKAISRSAQVKSLELLSRLQKIQQRDIPRLKRV
jgi:arsenate reductase-like glutaredoxin family protein